MKKIKTSELTGAALNWAVAKCEGVDVSHGLTDDERYSTNWAQGGPIIDRKKIGVAPLHEGNKKWASGIMHEFSMYTAMGPTPLVAAMRCYVASELGDEVEVPEELCASN